MILNPSHEFIYKNDHKKLNNCLDDTYSNRVAMKKQFKNKLDKCLFVLHHLIRETLE